MTRRTPPTVIESPRTGPAVWLATVLLSLALAGPALADRFLEIQPGVEVTFPTQRGNAYLMEISTDLEHWLPAGPFCFGDGRPVHEYFPAASRSGQRHFFRLRILDAGSIGLAPVSLTGQTLVFNEGFQQRRFDLIAGGLARETTNSQGLTYSFDFLKCAPDEAKLELFDDFTGQQTIHLSFTSREVGSYRWVRRKAGRIADIDEGTFTTIPTRRFAGLSTGGSPASVTGLTAVFDLGVLRTVVFSEDTRLQFSGESSYNPSAYIFSRYSDHKATLRIFSSNGVEEVFELEFIDRWGGSFIMRQYHEGVVEDVERGTFSLSGGPLEAGGTDPGDDGGGNHSGGGDGTIEPIDYRPASLAGFALDILVKYGPRRLCFTTLESGHSIWLKAGSPEYCPFTYHYEKIMENRARLTITYPGDSGDEVEVYDLSFTGEAGGNITHRDSENEEAEGDKGVFTTLRDLCGGTQEVDWGESGSPGTWNGYRHADGEDESGHEEEDSDQEEAARNLPVAARPANPG
ncbi:MAG TPA: hypothetical protein VMN36_11515 [Verrucomicrobiales bacterium]|nr:hypothetical protein [Verrucomicrobiales bacterium]